MAGQHNGEVLVYVGTYTDDNSGGIYVYRLDPSSGTLEFASKAAGIDNAFFLAVDSHQRYLYSGAGTVDSEGRPAGVVSAFSIDPETGGLTFLNQQPSRGALPCYLSIDKTGRYLLAANYISGDVALLPIQDDGQLAPVCDTVQHEGSSIDPERQEGPHVHSIVLDPASRFAFAADLGLDKVLIYHLDATQGKLTPNDPPWVQTKSGAGPRHFAFHPNGRYAYLINELDNTFNAFAYDGSKGTLAEIQTVSTLPDDYAGESHCADVQVYPSGKFLYGSNRGHDSIVIFAIDADTGRLDFAGLEPSQGEFPWNLAFDPTFTFLLVANRDSDNVVVFRIDQGTGQLSPTGQMAKVPKPVCIKMLHRPVNH